MASTGMIPWCLRDDSNVSVSMDNRKVMLAQAATGFAALKSSADVLAALEIESVSASKSVLLLTDWRR